MKAKKAEVKQKQSMTIRPGTGSGHGVKSGITETPISSHSDKRGLGRKGSAKVLT